MFLKRTCFSWASAFPASTLYQLNNRSRSWWRIRHLRHVLAVFFIPSIVGGWWQIWFWCVCKQLPVSGLLECVPSVLLLWGKFLRLCLVLFEQMPVQLSRSLMLTFGAKSKRTNSSRSWTTSLEGTMQRLSHLCRCFENVLVCLFE